MYSSNYLLSQMGVPYDDCDGQAAIDKRLSDAKLILAAVKGGTFRTPNYVASPNNGPDAFDPKVVLAETASYVALMATIETGNVMDSHAALVQYDALRAPMGLGAFRLPSDLDILERSHESVGPLVRRLLNMPSPPDILANPSKVEALLAKSDAQATPVQAPSVPTVPIDAASASMIPAGMAITAPDGQKWIMMKTPFGSFLALASALRSFGLAAAVLLALFVSLPQARAQVNLRFTPEPMAVPVSVLANAKDLGRWTIEGCNDGASTVTIAAERVSMAAGAIKLIDQDDALLVLNAHVKRSPAAALMHYLSLAGQGAAIGLSVAGTIKNPLAVTAMSVGSALIPQLSTIAQGEVPSAVSLTSGLKYPLTIPPGGCFTDHRFAGKMKAPVVVTGVIK